MRGRRARVAAVVALGAAVLAGAASALVPDDPDASHWSYSALNLPRAWDLMTGSPRVVIAVVDSGVQDDHPELAGAAIPGYDFVEDRPGAVPVDGHGTAVAGAARQHEAATASAASGPVPVARSCRCRWSDATGSPGTPTSQRRSTTPSTTAPRS